MGTVSLKQSSISTGSISWLEGAHLCLWTSDTQASFSLIKDPTNAETTLVDRTFPILSLLSKLFMQQISTQIPLAKAKTLPSSQGPLDHL